MRLGWRLACSTFKGCDAQFAPLAPATVSSPVVHQCRAKPQRTLDTPTRFEAPMQRRFHVIAFHGKPTQPACLPGFDTQRRSCLLRELKIVVKMPTTDSLFLAAFAQAVVGVLP